MCVNIINMHFFHGHTHSIFSEGPNLWFKYWVYSFIHRIFFCQSLCVYINMHFSIYGHTHSKFGEGQTFGSSIGSTALYIESSYSDWFYCQSLCEYINMHFSIYGHTHSIFREGANLWFKYWVYGFICRIFIFRVRVSYVWV